MSVRICEPPPSDSPEQDFVRVHASTDPLDDTVTRVTIQRVMATPGEPQKEPTRRVKTLITSLRMPPDVALGLATRYAESKRIPVVYTEGADLTIRCEDD